MASHNRVCLSGQGRQGGQYRNFGGQHHHIMHKYLSMQLMPSLYLFKIENVALSGDVSTYTLSEAGDRIIQLK